MTSNLTVGDTVGYSHAFLKSTGMFTGDMPRAKGKITCIDAGFGPGLATIDWDKPNIPRQVLVTNLAKVGTVAWAD